MLPSPVLRVALAVAGAEGGLFALQATTSADWISPGAAILAGF